MSQELMKTMHIRHGDLSDAARLAEIELACFPPEQAASAQEIRDRLSVYPDCFWLMCEGEEIIAFADGFATDEKDLRDEMYADASMHDPDGNWQMIFGVNTIPERRNRGIATRLIQACLEEARSLSRKGAVLTCLENMIPFYERLGFANEGISQSVHGDAIWYQMRNTFRSEEE